MRTSLLIASLCLLPCTAALARPHDPPQPELQGWMHGFAGELEGKVLETWDSAFTIEVSAVANVWKHSEAKHPDKAVGQTYLINLQWEKHGEGWAPRPRQVRWLSQCVKVGDQVKVDVKNDEGQRLHLMELNREQRAQLEGRAEGAERGEEAERRQESDHDAQQGDEGRRHPPVPPALRGFSGQVRGTVVRVYGDDAALFLIEQVLRTWKGNEAREPEAAVWRAVLVQPRRGEQGPSRRHARFIASLKPGEQLSLELRAGEERVEILELSQEQRERAGDD